MKRIFYTALATSLCLGLSIASCSDKEKELLEPKVYFEQTSQTIEVEGNDSYELEIQARVSSLLDANVPIRFSLGDASLVEAYNQRAETTYEALPEGKASLTLDATTIRSGEVYSDASTLRLTGLQELAEGKTYLVPIRLQSAGETGHIEAGSTLYTIIRKPVRILKAVDFSNGFYLKPEMPQGTVLGDVTYEALIWVEAFQARSPYITTVMGREGVLMLRFGDANLKNSLMQIAGHVQFNTTTEATTGKWMHLAYVHNASAKQSALYINGTKVAEGGSAESFDLSSDFFIGKIAGFMWGERPFSGKMSEVRLWRVARSESQLRENMLSVDASSTGLVFYYKLNGTDHYEDSSDHNYYIKDQSPNGIKAYTGAGSNRLSNRNTAPSIVDLDAPIKVN